MPLKRQKPETLQATLAAVALGRTSMAGTVLLMRFSSSLQTAGEPQKQVAPVLTPAAVRSGVPINQAPCRGGRSDQCAGSGRKPHDFDPRPEAGSRTPGKLRGEYLFSSKTGPAPRRPLAEPHANAPSGPNGRCAWPCESA